MFHTKFVSMFMIYQDTNFNVSRLDVSLAITIKQNAKYRFHIPVKLIFIL